MARVSIQQVIDTVLGRGSFTSRGGAPEHGNIDEAYRGTLLRAAEKTGLDEAVTIGEGTVDGKRVAVICSEFDFLGGSIGAATAHRIIHSIERATAEQLPLLLSPTSGGTRMQEGTAALALMISITTAVARHKDLHLPFLVYLHNLTTGGVMVSWGSAGHFTFAEPDTLLGFLGPCVVELATGDPMPEGVQTSENLFKQGTIDGIIPLEGLRGAARRTIDVLADRDPSKPTPPPAAAIGGRDTWEAILCARDTSRPGGGNIIDALVNCPVPISGTGDGHKSLPARARPTRIGERPVILVVQNRHNQPPLGTHPMGPGSLRFARRAMRIAENLNIPLVAVTGTPGVELTKDAEENAMAGEIVYTLTTLVNLKVPTVSLILDQGCGGGALAMLPSDRVLAMHDTWMSPLPPEDAPAIIYRDIKHAPEVMEEQGVGAEAMLKTGVVDEIVAEPEGPAELPRRALSVVEHAPRELEKNPARVGREQRFDHYRRFAPGE